MARVVLFHHAQGLTSGVEAFADHLRAAGHEVHTPDLFDGETFETLDAGMEHVRKIGFGGIMERGTRAADRIGGDAVYAGFSLGVVPAQMLAQTRSGALGAVLCYSCLPASEFGESWPAEVPVQIHGMEDDAFFAHEGDLDAARELVNSAPHGELFLYPGDKHLFADSSLSAYDAPSADLLTSRVIDFLDGLG